MLNIAKKLSKALQQFNPEIKTSSSGSIYIKLSGCKVKQIRVANHPGRKTGASSWELRSDAVTGRYRTGRVYSINAVNLLIADILK